MNFTARQQRIMNRQIPIVIRTKELTRDLMNCIQSELRDPSYIPGAFQALWLRMVKTPGQIQKEETYRQRDFSAITR